MDYSIFAPTKDPEVLRLRAKRERLEEKLEKTERQLEKLLPTPRCRLCKVNYVTGEFDWTVCGPCWNVHDGKLPPP